MTKKELLDFVKKEFKESSSGKEFDIHSAFGIFLMALEEYGKSNMPKEEFHTLERWMKKIWGVYLENHEV